MLEIALETQQRQMIILSRGRLRCIRMSSKARDSHFLTGTQQELWAFVQESRPPVIRFRTWCSVQPQHLSSVG